MVDVDKYTSPMDGMGLVLANVFSQPPRLALNVVCSFHPLARESAHHATTCSATRRQGGPGSQPSGSFPKKKNVRNLPPQNN